MRIKTLRRVTRRAVQDWWDDNCLGLAAPLALFIVGLVGMVLDRQQAASQLAAQLESLMGPAAAASS